MAAFVDRVVLHVAAGNGGHGCASVHREKFKPLGGPDGGNGGNGGDVVLVVDPQVTTLLEYHHTPHRRAGNGRPGEGQERHGAAGEALRLPVPQGTVVKDSAGTVLADLIEFGQEYVVVSGGRGGLGNKALSSPRRKAPGFALLGEPGQSQDLVLELTSLADVALIGFPSAGNASRCCCQGDLRALGTRMRLRGRSGTRRSLALLRLVVARPLRPSRWTLPITALRVLPGTLPAI